MSDRKILVTGAKGCIGVWVLRHLIDEGADFVASDLDDGMARPQLLLSESEIADVSWASLDVTDTGAVQEIVASNGITHIIHLAGLQVPFCRANPPLGAAVNVLGTVNILEAVRHNGVKGLSYASSLAALGPPEIYDVFPVGDDAERVPATLYGVYKVANEESARIYWQDWQVGSTGLRPCVVYGVARDQGVSADIAKAVMAAAAGLPFHIRFDGQVSLQHAGDAARMFIGAALAEYRGAKVCNMRNDVIEVTDFVKVLNELCPGAQITVEAGNPLSVPADLDDSGLRELLGEVPHLALREAIVQDVALYRTLIARDRIDLTQLER